LLLICVFAESRSEPVLLSRPFLGLETKTETLAIRSRDRDRDLNKMNSSALESRDHGLEITTSIPIGDSTRLKVLGVTNYGNRATGVGTKHAVLRVETKTETWVFRSRDRDRDRDLDKMNSSALESRDHNTARN